MTFRDGRRLALPKQMKSEWCKGVEEERGELVHAVEDDAVLPHHHGVQQAAHAEHIVGLGASKSENKRKYVCIYLEP